MTKIKKLVAVALAFLMVFGTVSVSVFAAEWSADTDDGKNLVITTKILRDVNGTWQETEKVRRGEAVKVRIYLNTSYFAGPGELLFFYDNNFFKDEYGSTASALTVNTDAYSRVSGWVYGSKSASQAAQKMVDAEKISADFLANHNFVFVTYTFNPATDGKNLATVVFQKKNWFCEFDLTVKEDVSTGSIGNFLAVEDTVKSPSFTAGQINVSKVQYNKSMATAVNMANWTASVTLNNASVSLYENFVNAKFDANGGKFDTETTVTYSGEAGDAFTAPVPTKFAATFLGWAVKGTSKVVSVTEFPAQDTEYVAVWDEKFSGEETVSFKTEIFRYDEETEEWIYTEKVKPGENVKARLYVDTNYYTNAGDIILFYDSDFFEDNYICNTQSVATTNPDPTSSAVVNGTTSSMNKLKNPVTALSDMIEAGYITKSFVETHTAFTVTYKFTPSNSKKLSGEKWFLEFDLKVRDDASGTGNFFMVEETVQTEERTKAFVSIPLSSEDGTNENATSLYLHTININIDDTHSVSTYSTVTFNANGGMFENNEVEFVYPTDANITANIGDKINTTLIPTVQKAGSTFVGWVPSSVAEPTEADVVEIPETLGYEELSFKAYWKGNVKITFVDHNKNESYITVPGGVDFEEVEVPKVEGHYFVGWTTDSTFETITGLPDVYPTENTVYYAVYATHTYQTKYYVSAQGNNGFESVGSISSEYGSPIVADPPVYTVPEGYTLSHAYTDPTLKTLLAANATVPEGGIALYFALIPNTYNVTFDADGGKFADGSSSKVIPTKFEERIVPPTAPTRDGYSFSGWSPDVGAYLDTPNAITYKATWEANIYDVLFYSEGDLYDCIPTAFGEEIELPGEPERTGYSFIEWSPSLPETMPAKTLVVNAKWEKNEYTVSFNAGEGSFKDGTNEKSSSIPYQDAITPPAEEPTNKGFAFLGWAKSTDENKTIVTDFGKVGAEDVEYVAVWGNVSHTVRFYSYIVSDHEDITEDTLKFLYHSDSVSAGETVEFPGNPDPIEYFVFKGWVDEDGNEVKDGMEMPNEDLNIYANFERVTVKLIPKEGSTTVVERDGAIEKNADNSVTYNRVDPVTAGDYNEWFIYGLKEEITKEELLKNYIDVYGDGRIVVTPINAGTNNQSGTGTLVEVYDNVTGQVVETFHIVVFGDLDGDARINALDVSIASDEALKATSWSYDAAMAYRFKAANLKRDSKINQVDVNIIDSHALKAGVINQVSGTIEYDN